METAERAAGRHRDDRADAAIIDAVLDQISAGGTLSGLSLVTIARTAGVSRNSVYRRWKTKDDLYLDVLASINRPLPDLAGQSVRDDLVDLMAVIIERTLDPRASRILRALNAEAELFPELHRRYFSEVVTPRRQATMRVIQRGIDTGELRPDIDVNLTAEVLVAPILSRMSQGATADLDPVKTSERIVDLLFAGIESRSAG
jgi:AcrR family transcriptional regulator